MSGVDISRENCEEAARFRQDHDEYAAALILALRTALDSTERERGEARGKLKSSYEEGLRDALDPLRLQLSREAADATGYARGVREAADTYKHGIGAILALLPAANEKRLTRYMGQIMAECDCPRQAECQNAERCLAEKEKNDAE